MNENYMETCFSSNVACASPTLRSSMETRLHKVYKHLKRDLSVNRMLCTHSLFFLKEQVPEIWGKIKNKVEAKALS